MRLATWVCSREISLVSSTSTGLGLVVAAGSVSPARQRSGLHPQILYVGEQSRRRCRKVKDCPAPITRDRPNKTQSPTASSLTKFRACRTGCCGELASALAARGSLAAPFAGGLRGAGQPPQSVRVASPRLRLPAAASPRRAITCQLLMTDSERSSFTSVIPLFWGTTPRNDGNT